MGIHETASIDIFITVQASQIMRCKSRQYRLLGIYARRYMLLGTQARWDKLLILSYKPVQNMFVLDMMNDWKIMKCFLSNHQKNIKKMLG